MTANHGEKVESIDSKPAPAVGASVLEQPERSAPTHVDLPDLAGEATITVRGFAYDDEPGELALRVAVGGLTLRAHLDVDEAIALEEDLGAAIDHADGGDL